MLSGYVLFEGHKIRLNGVDNSESLEFFAEATDMSTVDMFDETERSSGLSFRNIKVTKTKVKSEINNKRFCSIFSATIRYAKSNCYSVYRDALFTDNTGFFVPERSSVYHIPNIGDVKLKDGYIEEAHIKTKLIEIELKTVNDLYDTRVFTDFDAKSYTVKLDESSLGFKPYVSSENNALASGYYSSLEEIIENFPMMNFKWLLDRKYIIVDDSNLEQICDRFMKTNKPIAFDTETTGLTITFKSRIGQADVLVGVILTDTVGESYYFPLQHKAIKNLCDGDHEYVMTKYIKPILENKKIVTHNGSFDWKVAYIYDINTNIIFDTMYALQITKGYEKKGYRVGLKDTIRNVFGRDSLELSNLVRSGSWNHTDIKFWDLPYELVRLYACADGDNTLELYQYFEKIGLIDSYGARKVFEFELIFAKCVGYQEFYGHMLDVEQIPALQSDIENIMASNYLKMKEIVGEDFNPGSDKQMKHILYEKLGLPIQYKFVKGQKKATCDKDARKELMEYEDENGEPLYPIVHYYHEWCDADTINSNFLKGLPTLSTQDGFMFTGVKQFGTTTGRVSTSAPNYQGYNKPVKTRIKARPGYYYTDNDYSSIEYRVLAWRSGQQELIDAFFDPDLNYHTYQAARIFSLPYEAVTEQLRKRAKGINFGLPYGMGDPSLGARVFGERTPENTAKAAKLRTKYFEGQELVLQFFERVREDGVKNGYTETAYGRRRYYDSTKFDEKAIRRQAGNAVIQGTAADLYKLGVCRIFLKICEKGWLGKVLMPSFVHDETTFEVHESINPTVWLKAVKEAFEMDIDGCCPLYIGFGYGSNWYEAKSTEIPVQLQNQLVEKYGETGYPDWDGDINKFCKFITDSIKEYEIGVAKEFITNEENQGKMIKPVPNEYISRHSNKFIGKYLDAKAEFIKENDLTNVVGIDELKVYLHDVCKKSYTSLKPNELIKYKAKYLSEEFTIDKLKEKVGEDKASCIDGLQEYINSRGIVYLEDYRHSKDLSTNLDIFCKTLGIDREKVDIRQAIAEKKESSEESLNELDTRDEDIAKSAEQIRIARIKSFGLYMDTDERVVTFNLLPNEALMGRVKESLNREGKGYKVRLLDLSANKLYETPSYIEAGKINDIQQLYLFALNR